MLKLRPIFKLLQVRLMFGERLLDLLQGENSA